VVQSIIPGPAKSFVPEFLSAGINPHYPCVGGPEAWTCLVKVGPGKRIASKKKTSICSLRARGDHVSRRADLSLPLNLRRPDCLCHCALRRAGREEQTNVKRLPHL